MSKKIIGLAAAALTGLFVLSTGVAPAVAAHGGGGGAGHGGGGGGHAFSGGGHSPGGGRSFSGRSSGGHGISGNRVYGYTARGHRGHGHGRRVVGIPYGYSDYDYGYYGGTCAYEYNRWVATGSAYWWNRYQDCVD